MLFHGLPVVVDRHRVVLTTADGGQATARWDGRRLSERTGLVDDWNELETLLARDEAEALAARVVDSAAEAGVDLTLIDWMLGLSPTERLNFLRQHAASLAPFVDANTAE